MKLSEFLLPDAIITDLEATTKEAAIREIVRSVQDAGHLAAVDTEVLTEAFVKRECSARPRSVSASPYPTEGTRLSNILSARSPCRPGRRIQLTRW